MIKLRCSSARFGSSLPSPANCFDSSLVTVKGTVFFTIMLRVNIYEYPFPSLIFSSSFLLKHYFSGGFLISLTRLWWSSMQVMTKVSMLLGQKIIFLWCCCGLWSMLRVYYLVWYLLYIFCIACSYLLNMFLSILLQKIQKTSRDTIVHLIRSLSLMMLIPWLIGKYLSVFLRRYF